jgi:hypothetical protein
MLYNETKNRQSLEQRWRPNRAASTATADDAAFIAASKGQCVDGWFQENMDYFTEKYGDHRD